MLTICPECELQLSNKALVCPHCGYPIQETNITPVKPNKRRKRLPNGFGQISELKDKNLRYRFRAMVTVGKDGNGKPICKILKPQGYFKSYNDAYAALVEYNKNPYELDDQISVEELYERWTDEYFKTLKNDASKRTIISAWRYCSSIYKMRVKDLRSIHIKGCMNNGTANIDGETKTASAGTKARMKSMFNLMLDYALEHEVVDKNVARTFVISDDIIEEKNKNTKEHLIFSDEEMEKLWNHVNIPFVDVVLIQCYMGWRPQELGLIRVENVHLDEGYIIGGMKTKAGTNRVVPIHPKIRKFVEARYKEAVEFGSEYLINFPDRNDPNLLTFMTYDKYRHRFDNIRKFLGLKSTHRPHDGRKHFVTMAKENNVDEYAIKYIVGHQIDDLTEKTYTERNINWLIEEMQKIK